jgi:hypothetical protein
MGKVAELVVHHRRAVELDLNNVMAVFNLGVTLEEGYIDIHKSINVYEQALRLDTAGSKTLPPGCFRETIAEALAGAWAQTPY